MLSTVGLPANGKPTRESDVADSTSSNVWAAGESLTTPQLLTLIVLTAFDVALLIAAIAWNKHKKRIEKRKKDGSTELHENHFSS